MKRPRRSKDEDSTITMRWDKWRSHGRQQHHWNTGAKEDHQWNLDGPRNRQASSPQPTKYLALCWDYHRVWTPTHRRAIKEDSKIVNRDWVNHQACRLSHHIYIIAYAFVSHDNFLKLIRYDFYANHPLTFCKPRQIILSMLICFPLQIFLKLDRQHFIIQIADRKKSLWVYVCVREKEREREWENERRPEIVNEEHLMIR